MSCKLAEIPNRKPQALNPKLWDVRNQKLACAVRDVCRTFPASEAGAGRGRRGERRKERRAEGREGRTAEAKRVPLRFFGYGATPFLPPQ